jgi:hypothetical protein
MSDDTNHAETLIIKPTSIEITNQSNGIIHQNGNHSPSKSLKLKIGHENPPEPTNGHEHIYETPSNNDSYPSSSFETPTDNISSTPTHNGIDSGLSSEMTNATNSVTEMEKTNIDDEISSTSGISSDILTAARLLETNVNETVQPRASSPTSGVIIPEEKRVTERVKVFEAAANNDQSTLKKQTTKNGNHKKSSSSFSSADNKQNPKREQVSPTSTEHIDVQLTNESKTSTTTKNKTKRPSLKKQIQNLLKIDKSSSQEEPTIVEEAVTNGKKSNTINSTRTKRDNGKKSLIFIINNRLSLIRCNS